MILILPAFILVLVWMILGHVRKQRIAREYLMLGMHASEKGIAEPVSELLLYEYHTTESSLRMGILSLTIGIALIVLQFSGWLYNLLGAPWLDWDVSRFLVLSGVIACALGIGNILIWIFVDKPRRERLMKILQEKRAFGSN